MKRRASSGLLASTLALLAACSSTAQEDTYNPDGPGGGDSGTKDAGKKHKDAGADGSTPGDDDDDDDASAGDDDATTGDDDDTDAVAPPPNTTYDCNWGPPVFTKLAPST